MRQQPVSADASVVALRVQARSPERPRPDSNRELTSRRRDASLGGGHGQRERLIDAMIDVAASQGYVSASVARVSRAAGVSSETFYEHFQDREDCLLAAYRAVATRLGEMTEPPGAPRPRTMKAWRWRAARRSC